AFEEIVRRIARTLADTPSTALPVRMYVAGGAALHLHTGTRVSEDVDGVFSRRIALPADLEVAYRDSDGTARLLYLYRQYDDSFGLLHEDAYDESVAVPLEGIDPGVLDVRLLSALDLAVSKIARLSEQDREDIATLAERGLVDPDRLMARATEAAQACVGDVARLRSSIDIAVRIARKAMSGKRSPKRKR
ncbi:MAG: DUF6036 family nucleotidyltransferase, partial [Betaproteobacteria bacterium]